jgi:sulfatase maturation enzyme AslB (radical SAM superfamily)
LINLDMSASPDPFPTVTPRVAPGFHVMAKPIGPICNLDCKYCFYLEKEKLFPSNENFKMTDETLETYVRQFIEQQASPEIHFAWQGGEPTLLGVDFFARRSGSRKNTPTAKKSIMPSRPTARCSTTSGANSWSKIISWSA